LVRARQAEIERPNARILLQKWIGSRKAALGRRSPWRNTSVRLYAFGDGRDAREREDTELFGAMSVFEEKEGLTPSIRKIQRRREVGWAVRATVFASRDDVGDAARERRVRGIRVSAERRRLRLHAGNDGKRLGALRLFSALERCHRDEPRSVDVESVADDDRAD